MEKNRKPPKIILGFEIIINFSAYDIYNLENILQFDLIDSFHCCKSNGELSGLLFYK